MNDNKRIAFNSLILFVRLFIVSVIGLLSSRFVLQALGASDYGLYSVVGGIVALLNVFCTAMVTTTYRYIAFELGKGEKGNLNRIFNTSFAIHAVFGLLILVVGLPLGEWYVSNYLNVPNGSLPDAHFVLRISIITAVVTTTLVPFQGLLIAFEKFYVSAIFDIVCQTIKLLAIIALIYSDCDKIRTYSIIMLAYNVVYAMLFYVYCRKCHYNVIKFKIVKDSKLYTEMFGFTGWILFGAAASIGKTQGSSIIINMFFGTIINAAFAIANQVENFILMFSRMLNQAAVPQITKNYSGGNMSRSVKLASYISKYTYVLMMSVAFPVILEIDFLLGIWLKDVPDGARVFCQLMILGGLIDCMGEGLYTLTQASGKIKLFQIILSTWSLMGLPISYILFKLGAEPYVILVIFAVLGFVAAFIRLFLLKKILLIKIRCFFTISYSRMFIISIPLVIAYYYYDPSKFSNIQHFIGIFFLEIFYILDVIVLGLDKKEREIISVFLNNKIVKYKKHICN